jgi:hypothetical protein
MKNRITSIIHGRDNEVLSSLLNFYDRPQGTIADLTCNSRRMWKGLNVENVVFCDINKDFNPNIVCDYNDGSRKPRQIS